MSTFVNIIHILSTAVWIGGAFFVHFILQPAMKEIDPQQSGKLMGIVSKRFSLTAWISILLLVLTGLIKTPTGMLFNTDSDFGVYLLIKHLLIVLVIAVGLVIAFYIVPQLRKNTPKPGEIPSSEFLTSQKRLGILAKINLVLGILIIVFASMLW